MFIVLNYAESILDSEGAEGQEIYGIVTELSQFNNLCLVVISRVTTVPPYRQRLGVPTLPPIDAARTIFYGIYRNNEQSDPIDEILEQ